MSIRIMTYNILNGGGRRAHLILQVLQTAQPDVVVLQEVFNEMLVRDLAQALNMDWRFVRGNSKRHLALLSRLSILSCRSYHPFPPIHRAVLEAEMEYSFEKRFRLFGVHLLASLDPLSELWRVWETQTIIKRVRQHATEPCLIVGDFNTIAPGDKILNGKMPTILKLAIFLQGRRVYRLAIREILSAGFIDCFRFLQPEEDGFTLPTPAPNTRLDYIFANESMRMHLQKCFVLREPAAVLAASDHYPLVAEFEL